MVRPGPTMTHTVPGGRYCRGKPQTGRSPLRGLRPAPAGFRTLPGRLRVRNPVSGVFRTARISVSLGVAARAWCPFSARLSGLPRAERKLRGPPREGKSGVHHWLRATAASGGYPRYAVRDARTVADRARVSGMDDPGRTPRCSPRRRCSGLLLPFWQVVIGAVVLVVLVLSVRRLARRGTSRMTTALLVTGGGIVGRGDRRPAGGLTAVRAGGWPGWAARRGSWQPVQVEVGDGEPGTVRHLGEDRPPRVDHHAAAEAGAAGVVVAGLTGRRHVALVLDRPRPQQHLPVVPPGVHHERRRDHQQVSRRRRWRAAGTARGSAGRSRSTGPTRSPSTSTTTGFVPGRDRRGLPVGDPAGDLHVVQMDLAVARGQAPVAVEDQRGVPGVRRVRAGLVERAGDHPDASRRAAPAKNCPPRRRPAPAGASRRRGRGSRRTPEGGRGPRRRRRPDQQGLGGGQVGLPVVAGVELADGDTHDPRVRAEAAYDRAQTLESTSAAAAKPSPASCTGRSRSRSTANASRTVLAG